MSGKERGMSELQIRKELLIAESEINRQELLKDWDDMRAGSRTFVLSCLR